MRSRELWPLAAVGLVAVIAARCSNSDNGGGSPPAIQHCEADLSAYLKGGSGARAKVASLSDLLTGEAATGRAGDLLLANDRIQVIIEAPNREIGPGPYGGNIVDADLVRSGEPTRDHFGELSSIFQLGRVMNAERVEVFRDGSEGGAAIVAATGRDALLDYIDVGGVAKLRGLTLPLQDTTRDMGLRVTSYYVLNPGENAVHVVQAFCNDGRDYLVFPVGDVIDSGGDVEAFAASSGFDKSGLDITDALANGLPERFSAWIGSGVAYGYMPPTDMNQMVTLSGITVSLIGSKAVADWLNADSEPEGSVVLLPGEKSQVARDFVVARDAAGVWDHYYTSRNTSAGRVEGVVRDAKGAARANARVVALKDGKTVSLFTADAAGRFSGLVPTGSITLQADDDAARSGTQTVEVSSTGVRDLVLSLPALSKLAVHVRDASGQPMPGKVTVVCEGECPTSRADATALLFRDTQTDSLPRVNGNQVYEIRYLDPTGDVEIPAPPGSYNVYVSRGSEWSLFSGDVTLAADEKSTVEAKLSHVVDTTGWMSGDFHVHAAGSSDSVVPNMERLRTYLAEGVDVIVATDHDVITDFEPLLKQIPRGTEFLRSMVGQELSTSTYGHYNAFPLVRDPAKRNGGAVDWATGTGLSMAPGDIFRALDAFPGEQVVQINHPLSGSGGFLGIQLDTRTLWTRRDPADFRIRGSEPDPQTGDTRLFDPTFTAMEIMNSHSTGDFKRTINHWMSLLSRGVRKTGTAVSDTHERHGQSGSPRTYVKTSTDSPAALDQAAFAKTINQGHVFGTNGPFLQVTAKAANGTPVSMGETLASNGQPVTVEIELRMPEWMNVNEVKVFSNSTGTETDNSGIGPSELPEVAATPTLSSTVTNGMRRLTATAELTLTKDAWIIVVAQGGTDLFPVVGRGGLQPLAFSNPIFVDIDGNGWTPPVDLAAERARVGHVPGKSEPLRKPLTEGELRHILANECESH